MDPKQITKNLYAMRQLIDVMLADAHRDGRTSFLLEDVKSIFDSYSQQSKTLKTHYPDLTFNLRDWNIAAHINQDHDQIHATTLRALMNQIDYCLNILPSISSYTNKIEQPLSNKIFVVHGHDTEMREAIARTLMKLGLEPIILDEQTDRGKTIIEKFFDHANDASFAIVLLSPDDLAYSAKTGPSTTKLRARQNAILELGFFLGKLGRDHVLTLYRDVENFEIPSDYSGVLFKQYDGANGTWRLKLTKELKDLKYDVDANKL